MPVISVAQMHVLASSGKLDGRVAAVGGYWALSAYPCPPVPHEAVLAGACYGGHFADSAATITPQTGPGDDAPIFVPETGSARLLWDYGPDHPMPVILVVHSGDSRAWQCRPEQRSQCSTNLVIDRLAWADGAAVDLTSPNSELTFDRLRMTPEQAAAAAVKPGEELLTAYPLFAIDMNNVDPRLLDVGAKPPYAGAVSNPVWYVRVATGTPDADGVLGSTARVVDDASGEVLAEMPLTVAADYRPARLVFESGEGSRSDFGANFYPRGEVNSVGTPIFADYVGLSSTPVALAAGQYVLRGFVGNQNGGGDIGDLTCDLPITVAAGANVAYAATFTKTSCSWAPAVATF